MARPIVLFDACVFYPARLRDLLLRIAKSDLFRARWTDRIHDEWIDALLARRPDISRERLQRTRALMDAAVPDCLVTDYERLIEDLLLPDPRDRHVLAAAICCQASVIVTLNARDFPASRVGQYGISVQHPDEFLASLFELHPAAICEAVRGMRANLTHPSRSVAELLDDLRQVGLAATVRELESMQSLL